MGIIFANIGLTILLTFIINKKNSILHGDESYYSEKEKANIYINKAGSRMIFNCLYFAIPIYMIIHFKHPDMKVLRVAGISGGTTFIVFSITLILCCLIIMITPKDKGDDEGEMIVGYTEFLMSVVDAISIVFLINIYNLI